MLRQNLESICNRKNSKDNFHFFSRRDRSESEKSRIRISYAHLLDSLHELASKYAVLLLGIDLKDYHHMRNGE